MTTQETTKHTLGPWSIGGVITVGKSGAIQILAPKGPHIGAVRFSENPLLGLERAEANAHLIASAPELLVVIKELYGNWREYTDTPNDWSELNEQVETAIAKAEGQAPETARKLAIALTALQRISEGLGVARIEAQSAIKACTEGGGATQ